jgi:hypothetical protein
MTVRVLDRQDQLLAETDRVSCIDEMAKRIRDQAVASARAQLHADQYLTELDDPVQRSDFQRHFLQALAAGVAQALAANDRRVLAVYADETTRDHGAEVHDLWGALAHLLVVVTAPSAALEAFVASLNRALGASLDALPKAHFSHAGPPLDIIVVTEQEVRLGVGMARLLSARLPPPVQLWQRQEE